MCSLLMDESCSLGVLGKTGRGLCEHLDIPRTSVEVTTSALSNSFASVGGFCAGSHEVCDHQVRSHPCSQVREIEMGVLYLPPPSEPRVSCLMSHISCLVRWV